MAVDSGSYTPETLARQRKMADMLLGDSMNGKPIQHWTQGLAQLAKAGFGGYLSNQADEREKTARADAVAQALGALGGGQPQTAAPSPMASPAPPVADAGAPAPQTGNAPDYGNAIAGIESGGKYDLTGPATRTGDRAYGKYQVMGANVPEWTTAALGKPMTPKEFLASPDAQEAVFKQRFGQYVDKYGPEGAAKAWFAGEKGMNNPNAKDVLGTSVQGYADRFNKALGPQPAPYQVAGPDVGPPNPTSTIAATLQGGGKGGAPSQPTPIPGAPPGISVDRAAVLRAMMNPFTSPAMQGALAQQLKPADYGFQTLPDGTIIRTDPRSGTVAPIYQAAVKPELKETGTDPITGKKSYMVFDPKTQTMKPVDGPQGQSGAHQSGGMLAPGVAQLDATLSGDDYLKQFSPEVQSAVKAYMNGDVMPSGNPRMQGMANQAKIIAQKYGADMGIPVSDATYSQRRTYRSQLGSNSPASAGGQAKAFNQGIEHMGDLAGTLEKLDNSNGMGIPAVASAVNSIRQGTSTDQSAIADKASSIGQTLAGEVGKLFSGSAGGGVHERELTRERFSTVKSKPQLAAALEGTLEMMQGGMTALEQRRDEVMGPNSGIRFMNPQTEEKIAQIRSVIDRLKGNAPSSSDAPPDRSAIEAEMRKRGLLK